MHRMPETSHPSIGNGQKPQWQRCIKTPTKLVSRIAIFSFLLAYKNSSKTRPPEAFSPGHLSRNHPSKSQKLDIRNTSNALSQLSLSITSFPVHFSLPSPLDSALFSHHKLPPFPQRPTTPMHLHNKSTTMVALRRRPPKSAFGTLVFH